MARPKAENDVVEPAFQELEKGFARHAALVQRDLEIAAELALEQAVHDAQLLLLTQGGGVLGLLPATLIAMHAGGIVAALEGLVGAEEGNAVAAAFLGAGSGITSHESI